MSMDNLVNDPQKLDDRPSADELIARVRTLQPLLRERGRRTELNRRISAETTAQLSDAGLFDLMKPRRFGGFEYGPSVMLRVGFELGRACGSTAWCTMIGNVSALFVSYWPLQAQHDVWGDAPSSLVAGTLVPTGQCERAEGGYRVKGRWPFASNCENADWVYVSSMLPEADGRSPGAGWFLTPRTSLHIDEGSWHVSGLQGTGSKTLFCNEPVFVPEHRMLRFEDVAAGAPPGRSIPGNIQAAFLFSTFGGTALVAPLLGMAQGALELFTESMRTKVRAAMRPGASLLAANNPFIQRRAGSASADLDAAMLLLLTDVGMAEEKLRSGGTLDVAERVRIRRDIGFGAQQAVNTVNTLVEASGASAADLDNPLQRHWRDINAGARHVSLDVDAINSTMGQQLFGLPPVGMY
jgi:alkylation response protein AidB-like acyl-CoA dehydrogenase